MADGIGQAVAHAALQRTSLLLSMTPYSLAITCSQRPQRGHGGNRTTCSQRIQRGRRGNCTTRSQRPQSGRRGNCTTCSQRPQRGRRGNRTRSGRGLLHSLPPAWTGEGAPRLRRLRGHIAPFLLRAQENAQGMVAASAEYLPFTGLLANTQHFPVHPMHPFCLAS